MTGYLNPNHSPLPKSEDEASLLRNWLFFSSPKSSTRISWLRVMSSSDSFEVWFEATDLFFLPQDSTDSCPHSHTACNSEYWIYYTLPVIPKLLSHHKPLCWKLRNRKMLNLNKISWTVSIIEKYKDTCRESQAIKANFLTKTLVFMARMSMEKKERKKQPQLMFQAYFCSVKWYGSPCGDQGIRIVPP